MALSPALHLEKIKLIKLEIYGPIYQSKINKRNSLMQNGEVKKRPKKLPFLQISMHRSENHLHTRKW